MSSYEFQSSGDHTSEASLAEGGGTSSSSMVAGMLTMGLYSALPAMPLPCTTKAVFSWMPTCAARCAGQRNMLPKHPSTHPVEGAPGQHAVN